MPTEGVVIEQVPQAQQKEDGIYAAELQARLLKLGYQACCDAPCCYAVPAGCAAPATLFVLKAFCSTCTCHELCKAQVMVAGRQDYRGQSHRSACAAEPGRRVQ
jgi:hypothetical protein